MLLVGEHEEDGWIQSTFTLTYRVAWEQLLLAVYGAYRYFSDPEVLVDGKPVEIGAPSPSPRTATSCCVASRRSSPHP